MKTVTRQFKVYKIDELTGDALETAIREHSEFEGEVWEPDGEVRFAKEELGEMGMYEPKIIYSGFYSQGDGASVAGRIDTEVFVKWLKANGHSDAEKFTEIGEYPNSCYLEIEQSGNYCHENTMGICHHFEINENPNIWEDYEGDKLLEPKASQYQELCLKLSELCLEVFQEKARDIWRAFKDDYEACTGRENCIKSMRINEYDFYESGKQFSDNGSEINCQHDETDGSDI